MVAVTVVLDCSAACDTLGTEAGRSSIEGRVPASGRRPWGEKLERSFAVPAFRGHDNVASERDRQIGAGTPRALIRSLFRAEEGPEERISTFFEGLGLSIGPFPGASRCPDPIKHFCQRGC